MSDGQQGTGYGEPGDSRAPTEWIGSDDPPTGGPAGQGADGGGRSRRRLAVALTAAAAALALIGGGAVVAFQVLGGGGPQPADAIPSSALAYARIDLDPSAEQKINALRLLRRVPELETQLADAGITSDTDDLRRHLFEEALADSEGCSDIDYAADIEPWIGDRAGAAALPGEAGEDPKPLVVVQVTDEDAARTGLQALLDCGADDGPEASEGGIAFVGDYALLAEDQEQADDFAAAAEEEPLSEASTFSADMDALDGEGLVSFWVDLDAVVAATEESEPEVAEALGVLGFEDLGSVAVALRAQSDALEVVLAGTGDLMTFGVGSEEAAGDVQALPETTLMAFGFTGGGDSVDAVWQRLQDLQDSDLAGSEFGPGALAYFAAQLEAQTGFTVPEDVGTLLGDEFTLAVDSNGFELDSATGQPDLSTINVGARMRTDPEAAGELISRIQELLSSSGAPFEIAQQEVDGGLVVAANEAYAESLADGGSLGDSDVFDAAVADANDAVAVAFVDLDLVAELVDRVAADIGQPVPSEIAGTLDVLRAFGASATVDGEYRRSTYRLVFD